MEHTTAALEFLIFIIAIAVLAPVLGKFMYARFFGWSDWFAGIIAPFERKLFRICGVNFNEELNWKQYTLQLILFNIIGFFILLLILLFQNHLPLNPQNLPAVEFWLAVNTAVSFTTNTNWQSYAGETTLSYFTQMAGLTVQNFLSAASGIAVLLVLIRAIKNRQSHMLGSFRADIIRITIYILLPLSVILAVLLMSQGVIQTFSGYSNITTLEGRPQTIPLGPVASQAAIKQLGTNGGGFFGANSAFPFENPGYFSNFAQTVSIILLPASLVFMFGYVLDARRHARMIFSVMLLVLVVGVLIAYISEVNAAAQFSGAPCLEGKELRFGIAQSILWSMCTTAASNGSVNAMISSLSPIASMMAMLNMQLGEIIFGGVGSGMYGMFLFIVLTVFIAGLMIGRTPEYFGKKIEAAEIKLTVIAILVPNLVILIFTAIGLRTESGLAGLLHRGTHGFSEIMYAFSSAAANNGSAFAGLNANSTFYNISLSVAMLAGRFGVMIPVLAIAGSMTLKNITPVTAGTLSVDTTLFGFLLTAVILIVGALTFFPSLALGPLLEHLITQTHINF